MHLYLTYVNGRYGPLESALKQWDDAKPLEENLKQFSWVPGVAYRPEREAQLRACLAGHPKADHIVDAIKQVHSWLADGGCLKRGVKPEGMDAAAVEEWAIAYDLQPDRPFPERG
jgi:hypothetical protein